MLNESPEKLDVETAVRDRYSQAAAVREPSLCCPVSYDGNLLEIIPPEVLEKDYGCGNPAAHVKSGETVLDLGSGSGKACFMVAQVVGQRGQVIGVDMNEDMLALARRHAPEVARRLGFANVSIRKGRIQDLALDIEAVDRLLAAKPVTSAADLTDFEQAIGRLRLESPLVANDSIDVVISNCVLNLVKPEDKTALFREIHRVLRRGGRAVISDIVSDEDVPPSLMRDPELWSGCISGALREDRFLQAFEQAGLYGITVLERAETPWRTVEGIEFRSVTVAAYKGKEGACFDHKQAVIYKGPFRQVEDDDGHVLPRGVPIAVCEKTFRLYGAAPYAEHFASVSPLVPVAAEDARPFPCTEGYLRRDPRETKGTDYRATTEETPARCDSNGACC